MEVQRTAATGLWYLSDERECIGRGMGMTLTLEIINPGAHREGVEPRKVFRNRGGTIGRLRDNDWFLPHDLVRRFHAARIAEGAELCVAASAGRTHPVIGLWSVALRDDLRSALVEEGLRKIDRWTARFRLATVPWPAEPVDPFFNANTVENLAEAERLAKLI